MAAVVDRQQQMPLLSVTLHDLQYCNCDDVSTKYQISLNQGDLHDHSVSDNECDRPDSHLRVSNVAPTQCFQEVSSASTSSDTAMAKEYKPHNLNCVCLICPKICESEELLEVHLDQHMTGESPLVCQVAPCSGATFGSPYSLSCHNQQQHNVWRCKRCQVDKYSLTAFIKHRRQNDCCVSVGKVSEKGEDGDRFDEGCEDSNDCDESYFTQENTRLGMDDFTDSFENDIGLQEDVRSGEDVDKYQYKSQTEMADVDETLLDESWSTNSRHGDLVRPTTPNEPEIRENITPQQTTLGNNFTETVHLLTVRCEYCEKVLSSEDSLRRHIQFTCKGATAEGHKYRCGDCGRTFRTQRYLMIHGKKMNHPAARREKMCGKCGRVFISTKLAYHHKLACKETMGSMYPCQLCGERFQSEYLLVCHICHTHSRVLPMLVGDERVRCKVCRLFMRTRDVLEQHLASHLIGNNVIKCQVTPCDEQTFGSHFQLYNHQRVVHDIWRCDACQTMFPSTSEYLSSPCLLAGGKCSSATFTPFGCPFCKRSFPDSHRSITVFRHHMDYNHFNNRNTRCMRTCNMCDEVFDLKRDLNHHKDTVHTTHEFACEHCFKQFKSYSKYSEHLRDSHVSTTCKICGVKIVGSRKFCSSKLKEHLFKVHETVEGIKCQECDEVFATNYYLKQHFNRVHASKKYLCEYCGNKYKSPHGLSTHLLLCKSNKNQPKTDKKYLCEICGKKYMFSIGLEQHRKFIHNINKTRPFSCSQCAKTFLVSTHLQNHIASVHSDERRFACSICGNKFKLKHQCDSHERTHAGGKLLQCKFCPETFKCYQTLIKHKKSTHFFQHE